MEILRTVSSWRCIRFFDRSTGKIGWAEDHVKQRVLVVKIYDPEQEPGRPYLFFHTLNDRHESDSLSVPLYVGGLQTIFVDGPSRSSATPSSFRVAGSTLHRRTSGVVSCFPPFVVVTVSFFFAASLRSAVGWNRYDPRRGETSGIQNSPRLRRLECRQHATGTDQTFIRHDQNAYSPLFTTMRVCEKNSRVRSCACRFTGDRNSVSFDARAKIAGKFDGTFTRTSEIPMIRATMAGFCIISIIYSAQAIFSGNSSTTHYH